MRIHVFCLAVLLFLSMSVIGNDDEVKKENIQCLAMHSTIITNKEDTKSCYSFIDTDCSYVGVAIFAMASRVPDKSESAKVGKNGNMVNVIEYGDIYIETLVGARNRSQCEFYSDKSLAFDGSLEQFEVLFAKCMELINKNGTVISADCQNKSVAYAKEKYFAAGKSLDPAKIKALLSTVSTTELTAEPTVHTTTTTTTVIPSTLSKNEQYAEQLIESSTGAKSMLVGLLLVFISI